MFKKQEESEWTRFSRALGGNPPASAPEAEPTLEDEPGDAPTLVQMPPASQPEVYMAPPPPPAPEPEPEPVWEPPVAQAPVAAPMSSTIAPSPRLESDETVLGDGSSIDGSIRSERSIRIRGAVQGEVESQQRVIVEENAKVQARITAEHVTVLGEVNGSIVCSGRLEVASSARVTGEVTAGTLVIQEGAFFEGNLKMSNGRAVAD
ncbi:MAG: polymer-forming cytoskeletal protein [Chloroflexota bacterium]